MGGCLRTGELSEGDTVRCLPLPCEEMRVGAQGHARGRQGAAGRVDEAVDAVGVVDLSRDENVEIVRQRFKTIPSNGTNRELLTSI